MAAETDFFTFVVIAAPGGAIVIPLISGRSIQYAIEQTRPVPGRMMTYWDKYTRAFSCVVGRMLGGAVYWISYIYNYADISYGLSRD